MLSGIGLQYQYKCIAPKNVRISRKFTRKILDFCMVYKNTKLFMCILLNGKIPESYKRRAAMSEYILAVDIGTSNVKCMIARPDMTVLAEADSEYETLCTGAGRYEPVSYTHLTLPTT